MHSNKKILLELVKKLWTVLRLALLFGMGFVIIYPVIYMLSVAFRDPLDMLDPSIIWVPKNFTLTNFQQAWRCMEYDASFLRSLMISGVSSVLQVASCSLVAYGFARFRFRSRNLLFGCLILTILVPPQVTILPLFLMFKEFGIPFVGVFLKKAFNMQLFINLLDTPWLFYLQSTFAIGLRAGICIFMLRQFFRGLPKELEEAAEIDGCSPLKTYLRIILPNAVPMMLTVFLFCFIWYWNDYYSTSIFISNNRTLAISLSQLRLALATETGIVSNVYESITQMQAGCLLFIFPLLILYVFTQRYFTESIDRSGLVG